MDIEVLKICIAVVAAAVIAGFICYRIGLSKGRRASLSGSGGGRDSGGHSVER